MPHDPERHLQNFFTRRNAARQKERSARRKLHIANQVSGDDEGDKLAGTLRSEAGKLLLEARGDDRQADEEAEKYQSSS